MSAATKPISSRRGSVANRARLLGNTHTGFFFGANALESTPVKCRKIEFLAFKIEFFAFQIEFFAFQNEFLHLRVEFLLFWKFLGLKFSFWTDFMIHCNFLVQKGPNAV